MKLDIFKFLDRTAVGIGVFCLALGCFLSLGAGELRRSERAQGVVIIQTSSSTATEVTQPDFVAQFNEVCWVNLGTDATQNVYISSFSTVDETLFGWAV